MKKGQHITYVHLIASTGSTGNGWPVAYRTVGPLIHHRTDARIYRLVRSSRCNNLLGFLFCSHRITWINQDVWVGNFPFTNAIACLCGLLCFHFLEGLSLAMECIQRGSVWQLKGRNSFLFFFLRLFSFWNIRMKRLSSHRLLSGLGRELLF